MIVRTWRGWVRTDRAAAYVDYIDGTGLAAYRGPPHPELPRCAQRAIMPRCARNARLSGVPLDPLDPRARPQVRIETPSRGVSFRASRA